MSSFDGLDEEDVKLLEKRKKLQSQAVKPATLVNQTPSTEQPMESAVATPSLPFADIVGEFEAIAEMKKAKLDKYKQVTLDIERELWDEFQRYAKLRHGFQRKFFNDVVRNFVTEVVRKQK